MKIELHPERLDLSNATLIFLHVPKAAGTTFVDILERQYPARNVYRFYKESIKESIREFRNAPEEKRARIRCLVGHMPFGLHQYLPGRSVYLAILRDPVERVISHYSYALRTPGHYLHRELVEKKMTLEDYIKSGITSELTNGQARMLSGDPAMDTVLGQGPVNSGYRQRLEHNIGNHFAAIGITERFDESLLLFGKLFGWKSLYYVKKNVSKARTPKKEIPKTTLRLIEQNNDIDMELYQDASKAFDEMLKHHGIDADRVAEFRTRNRLPGTVYRTMVNGWMKSIARKVSLSRT